MNGYAKIFAKGRPAFGGAGIDTNSEAGHIASHYLYYRRARGMGAQAALAAARELPATYIEGREYYGMSGDAGRMDDNGLRWIEDTGANGLRFVGDACDLASGYGRIPIGYYTDVHEEYSTLRAGVWQLPGKGRHARLVAGYREMDGGTETNRGSARIDCMSVWRAEMDSDGDLKGHDETREAARAADGIAESVAEDERDYNLAYERGRKAAEIDAELIAARREALPLLAEFRQSRRGRVMLPELVCELLQKRIRELVDRVDEKREALSNAWGDCYSSDEPAWTAGFMDESEGGFVRAVRLGYAKRTDWQGKPDENPLDQEGAV